MLTLPHHDCKSWMIQLVMISAIIWLCATQNPVKKCTGNSDCIDPERCQNGLCGGRCGSNSDCPGHQKCFQPDGRSPYCDETRVGGWCRENGDCPPNLVCHKAKCALISRHGPCLDDEDCIDGQVCKEKVCSNPSSHTVFFVLLGIASGIIVLVAFIMVLC